MPELADLEIAIDPQGEVHARLRGELDMETVDAIRARLGAAITSSTTALVIDLSRVSFMDSSGVELLFRLRAQVDAQQMVLRIVLPRDSPIRRTLEVSDGGAELLTLGDG